jgi:uracil-DNA glycosylase
VDYWSEIGLSPLWIQRSPPPLSTDLSAALDPENTSSMTSLQESFHPSSLLNVLGHNDVAPALIEEKPAHALSQDIQANTSAIVPISPIENSKEKSDSIVIPTADWKHLEEHIYNCHACSLSQTRTHAVPGIGPAAPLHASWMVIGEAPGAEEDKQGQPFVGQAGKLLDAMLASIGLSRHKNVYIANVLKCRPPNNRRPLPEEVSACVAFLHQQLEFVQPNIVIALGATAAQALLNTDAPIGQLRGKVHDYQGRPLIVTYHPAYLLRSPTEKFKAWEDLCLAKRTASSKMQDNI